MIRALAPAIVVIGLFLLAGARAQAAAEFCPATLVGTPVAVDASSVRFRLGAISPRNVSGVLRLQTEKGWYAATFDNVPFKQIQQSYSDQGFSFSHEDYLSEEIIVKLPVAAPVLYA